MKARTNKKRGGKRRLKGAAFKKTAAYRKMRAGHKAWLAKRGGRRSAAKRAGGRKRKSTGGTRKRASGKRRTPAQRRATARMLRARWGKSIRKRKAWKNTGGITQAAANGRRRRRKARRNTTITQAAANRRRRRKSRKNGGITQAAANRRRRRKKARRNTTITQAAANRPRRRRRRKARRNQDMYMSNRRRRRARRNQDMYMSNRRRRRYRRNPDLLSQLKDLAATGALVGVGFLAHRALTYVVSEKLFTKIEALNTGSLAEYRTLIAGLVSAAAGSALVLSVAPKYAPKVGAGMFASFLAATIVHFVKKSNPEIAGYLAAYPDAEGKAFHTMSGYGRGMGSYFLEPTNGMGEYDYYDQYSGMGQITQAAAGMGEFYMPGLSGIGEYEAVEGFGGYGSVPQIDEGIHPNLHSAERALSVAEAAAGIGDMPLVSTVDAFQVAAPIQDAPSGSRAGILEGGDGIFG